ncbi:hypothetical protein [Microbulbifer taiwanensis]|uniref:Uncharacterized protein n=1 Tax=Microbulbifer taiwanensis TaxID=986746 RepID=A0ABW1YH82_9GAMM|nr:hypothetical protein [Microbulbifer taiwanensis]
MTIRPHPVADWPYSDPNSKSTAGAVFLTKESIPFGSEQMTENILLVLILGCEIAFWAVLLLGLIARYLFKWQKVGLYLLFSTPVIDLLLLVTTVVDLRNGAEATFFHGLAAAYIGFSLAFGRRAINWADARFAHRFAGGPEPLKTPPDGWGNLVYELKLWARALAACGITFILLRLMVLLASSPDNSAALLEWNGFLQGLAFLWFVFGPAWSVVFDRGLARSP